MTASRTNKPLFRVVSLLIFFLSFCVNQDLRGQDCTGVPDWSSSYKNVGDLSVFEGRLRQFNSASSNGLFEPFPPGHVWYQLYYTDLGVCISCSVGSASSTPTILKDVAMTNITHATGGVTGVTSSTGLPSGVTAAYSSDVLTISGTPTASGTYNYTIDLAGCGTDATGTIVVVDAAPGGEATNLLLWMKADAQTYEDASPGTDVAEDADDVLQWHDQSGLSHDATTATGSYPHYDEDAFNFNPGLVFTQSSSEYLQISGGIFDANTISGASAYVVCSHESATNSAVFNEPLTGSDEFMFLAQWSPVASTPCQRSVRKPFRRAASSVGRADPD
jgi:hypothetical protein